MALGGAAGYLLRGGQVRSARSDAARLRASLHSRRLATAHLNASRESEYTSALIAELLSFAGACEAPFCSSHDFPKIHVAILSPADGSRVRSPVIAHLLTDRPLGCSSDYYITVDGRLFEPVPTSDPRVAAPPESQRHPMKTRLVPRAQRTPPNGACFGGVYQYLEFRLRPGRHRIAIDGGCEMGTEVPQPVPSAVRFTVMR